MADFGGWQPDLPPFGHGGLVTARNVFSGPRGYEPIKDLTAITTARPETWKGGGFFESNGNNAMLAATNVALYSFSATWTSEFAAARTAQQNFAQFGDLVIVANGGDPVKYTIATGVGALLGGSPPDAAHVAIVKDFVFLSGNPAATSTVYWSAINNAEGWTIGTSECDDQIIPDGGAITGLAGGEYGLVFQADAINIFEYVGSPLIFTRRKISDGIGAMAHGSIASVGKMVFFLHRRGFYVFNDGELKSIGKDKIDRTFLETYSISDIENNIRSTVDKERSLVIWSMPDRLWIYNWDTDKWTDVVILGLVGIGNGATANATLEQIGVLYPSIEDVTPVLDDAFWRGGDPMVLLAKTDHILYTFGSGSNLKATLKMPKVEMFPSRIAHVRNARVGTDATDGITLLLHTSARLGDAQSEAQAILTRNNGDIPIRASGRYIQPEITWAAGTAWTYAQTIDLEATAGGRQ